MNKNPNNEEGGPGVRSKNGWEKDAMEPVDIYWFLS